MSKDKILAAIRKNKPSFSPLPEIPDFQSRPEELLAEFVRVVEAGGGKAHLLSPEEKVDDFIKKQFPDAETIASPLDEVASDIDLHAVKQPAELKGIDVAIIGGQLGVAENGAVWVTERDCIQRVLPFIAQHLVIVLPRPAIVSDMHRAYGQIRVDETDFGVFIAGPSKTADIEQALVIGAQGARSFTVLIRGMNDE